MWALAAVFVVGGPALFGDGVDIPDDALYYMVPAWDWLCTAVSSGQSIWFVPGKLGGTSLYVDVVPMGPLYPAWLLAMLMPTVTALGLASLLHAMGTLLAVRWLATLHGASPMAATLAGCGVVLGPIGLAGFQDAQMDSWATFLWLPMTLACLEKLAQVEAQRRARWIGLGALSLGMLLLGSHLRLAACSGAAVSLWLLLRGKDLRGGLTTLVLGVLIGLPGFLPMLLELSLASAGTGEINQLSRPIDQALGLHAIAGFLSPGLMVVGRDVGLGTVLAVAVVTGIGLPDKQLRRMVLFTAVLVLAGTHIRPLNYLLAPLVLLSHPVNLVHPALACFPAAVVAARGLDVLWGLDTEDLRRWWQSWQGRSVLLLMIAVMARVALGKWGFPSDYGWALYSLGAVQASVTMLLLHRFMTGRRGLARSWAVFLLCLVDLCLYCVRGHLAVPSQPIDSPLDRAHGELSQLDGGYLDIRDLALGYDSSILGDGLAEDEDEAWTQEITAQKDESEQPGADHSDGADTTRNPDAQTHEAQADSLLLAEAEEVDYIEIPELDGPAQQRELLGRYWPPHLGVSAGIRGLSGRSKLAPARQVDSLGPLAEALQDVEPDRDTLGTLFGQALGEPDRNREYRDSVTCGFEFCDHVGTRTLALHGIRNAVWDEGVRWQLDAVVPHCYSPQSVIVVEDLHERLRRLLTRPFQTAGPALLETELQGAASLQAAELSCREHGHIKVNAKGAALVVLRERWHPGWELRDGTGKLLATIPVNQAHTGVVVGPGEQTLDYRFVPPGLRISLLLAGPAALIALLMSLFGPRAGRRRSGPAANAGILCFMALLGVATSAEARSIEGQVTARSPDSSYEVWITTSLDLSEPTQPALSRVIDSPDGSFRIDLPDGHRGPSWLFLRQSIDKAGAQPLVFYLPYDLQPLEDLPVPALYRLRGIPSDLAELREQGGMVPGSWLKTLYLALLIYLGGGALLWALRRAHLTALGAQTLRATASGQLPDSAVLKAAARLPPLAELSPPPPAGPKEKGALALILSVAATLRILKLRESPIELLEYTYGPGSRAFAAGATEPPGLLAELLRPSSLEATHPPLYHWLLSGLGSLSQAEWLIRAPALVSSLLTTWLLWLLFRRLSPPAALLGAAGFACAAPSVHFGADATPYAFIGLVAIGSLLLLLRALRESGLRPWLAWLGLLVAGTLCHYAVVPFALAQLAALLTMTWLRRARPRWSLALSEGVRAGMILAPLPLLWSLLHFGYFPPIALDTRLFADTYPRDPGLLRFVAEFWAIAVGLSPDRPALALLSLPLLCTGLLGCYRRDRVLGNLLLVMLGAFFGGVLFFHSNLTWYLNGRVFYGFRWISWLLPLLMGLAACGALGLRTPAGTTTTGRANHKLRLLLLWPTGLIWCSLAAGFTVNAADHTSHPDYRGAAAQIRSQTLDRDAIATVPLWAQRGPLTWYLQQEGNWNLRERDDVLTWHLDERRVFLEAINERLPFQSGARNSHFERLWLAVVNERMFGRDKFSARVAQDALQWAQENLQPDGHWSFRDLELYRFRRELKLPPLKPGETLQITAAEKDLSSLPWLEPNMSGCIEVAGEVEQDDQQLGEADDDDSSETELNRRLAEDETEWRWLLKIRLPADSSRLQTQVSDGMLFPQALPQAGSWQASIEGGPCSGPAPVLQLRSRAAESKTQERR
ncbi:MAG: hypothetical protein CMP23_16505 [Rickettsiales bacterium]|nr:hypothetical protein [Rickettsiales bacterium]